MRKIVLFILSTTVCLYSVISCVDVNVEDYSSQTNSEKPVQGVSSEDTTEEDASIESSAESSFQEEPPVYESIYPVDYSERVAYYTNYELTADVNDAYFNDSVFVGNSIMLHYKNYVTSARGSVSGLLGNANFFAAASFSFYNNKNQTADQSDCAWPVYQGEKLNITSAVNKMGVQTVYLSLMALNDIAIYKDGMTGVDETFVLLTALIDELKNTNSNLNIVIIGNTYLHSSSNNMGNKLNNGSIHTFNTKVLDYCNQNGLDFIDVAYALVDDNGCLGTEFCSDVGSSVACHLNKNAFNAWTELLRDYAGKKQAGRWANPTELKGFNY